MYKKLLLSILSFILVLLVLFGLLKLKDKYLYSDKITSPIFSIFPEHSEDLIYALENKDNNFIKYSFYNNIPQNFYQSNLNEFILHFACNTGNFSLVNTLLKKGEDINLIDNKGKTPLHYASERNFIEIVHLLLNYHANSNILDNEGKTPLHYAIYNQNLELVEDLVKAGAEVNILDSYRQTPLHYAAFIGDEKIVAYLVENGADIHLKNEFNQTPFDIATHQKNKKVIHYLKNIEKKQ